MEVTDIEKNVRKNTRFWILQMKTHKIELVKNVKKRTFLILKMKTHIRDNHAEYRQIETSGLNPNRFEPKNVTNLQMILSINLVSMCVH